MCKHGLNQQHRSLLKHPRANIIIQIRPLIPVPSSTFKSQITETDSFDTISQQYHYLVSPKSNSRRGPIIDDVERITPGNITPQS